MQDCGFKTPLVVPCVGLAKLPAGSAYGRNAVTDQPSSRRGYPRDFFQGGLQWGHTPNHFPETDRSRTVGIGPPAGGSDSDGWTLCWGHSHAPGTRHVRLKLGRTFRGGGSLSLGRVPNPKNKKVPYVHTPTLSAPLSGGTLDRVGPPALQPLARRRPFSVAAWPFRLLTSRLPCTGQLNGQCTGRGKGTPHREPPCLTSTAADIMWSTACSFGAWGLPPQDQHHPGQGILPLAAWVSRRRDPLSGFVGSPL